MTKRRSRAERPPEAFETDFCGFVDSHVTVNELGKPFALFPYQREIFQVAFDFDVHGRLAWDTFCYSCIKKSGKSFLNALASTWWQFNAEAPNELYQLANDQEQSEGRTFWTKRRLIENNPTLFARATVLHKARIVTDNASDRPRGAPEEPRAVAADGAGGRRTACHRVLVPPLLQQRQPGPRPVARVGVGSVGPLAAHDDVELLHGQHPGH